MLDIISVLFGVGAIVALTQAIRKAKRQERLIASWSKVQATVTGSRQGWTNGGANTNRNVRFWPQYQFIDPLGALYVGESEVAYANSPEPDEILAVAFNPANPNQSFQVDAPSKLMIGCLIPAFAFIGLVMFWAIGWFTQA
ncbi:MAG TPA: DUF3592 domain-containing protein [Arthrobacter sp.]|nr:DUF3592 domain-containing protein [Arthrobacter sp.]